MKKTSLAALSLCLAGCGGGMNDLRQFVAEVQATPVPFRDTPVIAPKYADIPYDVLTLRSPFLRPQLSFSETPDDVRKDCPQPDLKRDRALLEAYAVDGMTLKGTLKEQNSYWALLRAGDGKVHSIRDGDYLGLYHGQVTHIDAQSLVITEWIPDGDGCWSQRDTTLALVRD